MKLGFFYPSYNFGGAELLYCKLAKYINNTSENECVLIDFKGGHLDSFGKENSVMVINVDNHGPLKNIPYELDVIVCPPNYLYRIHDFLLLDDTVKLLFWSIHPQNFESTLPFFKSLKDLKIKKKLYDLFGVGEFSTLKSNIRLLCDSNAIVFMDGANHDEVTQLFNEKLEKKLLPVPFNLESNINSFNECSQHRVIDNEISITWLGRVEGFKTNSILYLYKDIENFCKEHTEFELKLNVIGSGNDLKVIESCMSMPKNLTLNFLGILTGSKLTDFLLYNTDITFAMGISALDSASIGVPTVLIDIIADPSLSSYKYRWLYQTNDFNLGTLIRDNSDVESSDGSCFYEIISDLKCNTLHFKKESYLYSRHYHDIERTKNMLLAFSKSTKLGFETSKMIIRYGFIRSVYLKFRGKLC